jgi:hypothetical protein
LFAREFCGVKIDKEKMVVRGRTSTSLLKLTAKSMTAMTTGRATYFFRLSLISVPSGKDSPESGEKLS